PEFYAFIELPIPVARLQRRPAFRGTRLRAIPRRPGRPRRAERDRQDDPSPHPGGDRSARHRRCAAARRGADRLVASTSRVRRDGRGSAPADSDRPAATFSGGQQSRLMLAKLLLTAPDVMLLDEPSNHLDIKGTEWLENYLSKQNEAMIIVSHDRYFLDKVATK